MDKLTVGIPGLWFQRGKQNQKPRIAEIRLFLVRFKQESTPRKSLTISQIFDSSAILRVRLSFDLGKARSNGEWQKVTVLKTKKERGGGEEG